MWTFSLTCGCIISSPIASGGYSHGGIKGNEKADAVAKEAQQETTLNIPATVQDVKWKNQARDNHLRKIVLMA